MLPRGVHHSWVLTDFGSLERLLEVVLDVDILGFRFEVHEVVAEVEHQLCALERGVSSRRTAAYPRRRAPPDTCRAGRP